MYILGVAAFSSIGANPVLGLIFPVIVRAIGVVASIVGVYVVKARPSDKSALAPINRGETRQPMSAKKALDTGPSSEV